MFHKIAGMYRDLKHQVTLQAVEEAVVNEVDDIGMLILTVD